MIIPNIPDHRSVNFIEDQVVHILGFASYLISVAITHQAFVALRQPYTISKHKSIFEFQLNFIYGLYNSKFFLNSQIQTYLTQFSNRHLHTDISKLLKMKLQ